MFEKNKECSLSRFECFKCAKEFRFVSNFEHVICAINGKYSKNFYENINYSASLVIFQTYKNIVLRNVHSLGWFLSLCFYPIKLTTNLTL
jgi:hypothetical protein